MIDHFFDSAKHAELLGAHSDMPNDIYHGGIGVSSSVVKTMHKSPAHCYARHYDPERERDKSPTLIFGSAYHALALEGQDAFDKEFVLAPDINKRTKAGKEEWAEFEKANEGKDIIKKDDFDIMCDMSEALDKTPMSAELIDVPAIIEASYFGVDEKTDLLVKVRPDFYVEGEYILDLKTANDASMEGFSRSMANFGYFQSAAWYIDYLHDITGVKTPRFVLLVQEKEKPYISQPYVIDDLAIDLGRRMNRAAMTRLAACMARDEWPAYFDTIQEIELPRWYAASHGQ